MSGIFLTFLGISVSVGVVIAVLVLLSPLLNKRYAAKWKYFIWIFLAVRLLIPIGGVSGAKEKSAQPSAKPDVDFSEGFGENIDENALPPVRVVVEIPPQMTAPIAAKSEKESGITALDIVAWVWAVGGLSFLSVHIVSYLRYRRRVTADGRVVDNIDLLNQFDELKRSLRIDRAVTVMEYRRAESPMIMGFIKPILVLPRESFTAEELYFILKHELVHLKHGDVYFKLLFVAANALHWFNPLVWIMQKEASVDMELSCDERVTKGASIDAKKAYTETLMSTIHKRFSKRTVLSTQFYGGKTIMKKRFSNILTKRVKKCGISVLICAVALALYLGTMVGCTAGKPSDSDAGEDYSGMTPVEIANKALDDLEDDLRTAVSVLTMNMTEPVHVADGVDQIGNLREIDGEIYIPMHENYDTVDEIMELMHRVYTDKKCAEIQSEYFEDTFKEVDGRVYCIAGDMPYTPFNKPIPNAKRVSDTEILAKTTISYDGEDVSYEITLKFEDGKWKIDEENENSDAVATAEEIANKALTDLENDYNITVAILTMNMTEPVNLVEGVDQLGNLREIDGVSYIPMKEDYDTIDEIMAVFHKVYTDEKCAVLYSNYLDVENTGFMKEVDGKLYCMGGGKQHTAFNMPIESAEKISETEILAKTSVTYEYGDAQYEITLKYEDGKWKIDKLMNDGREFSY